MSLWGISAVRLPAVVNTTAGHARLRQSAPARGQRGPAAARVAHAAHGPASSIVAATAVAAAINCQQRAHTLSVSGARASHIAHRASPAARTVAQPARSAADSFRHTFAAMLGELRGGNRAGFVEMRGFPTRPVRSTSRDILGPCILEIQLILTICGEPG